MVTAQQPRPYTPRPTVASAAARPLVRPLPDVEVRPRPRAIPASRRRELKAWMTLLFAASLLLLGLGVLSLYGRICLTAEMNRRSALNTGTKQECHRAEELSMQRNRRESESAISNDAQRLHMVRPLEKEALSIP